MSLLKEKFDKEIRKELSSTMGLNLLAVPTLKKIVINMGIGRNKGDKAFLESAISDLEEISGQKPVVKKSKKPIAGFKLRQGEAIGVAVTLRGVRMWDFFENLVAIALPRVRDFKGVSKKSFDGAGNFNLGFREHIIFPAVDSNKVSKIKPLEVTICTTARNNEQGYTLLKILGMPFRD